MTPESAQLLDLVAVEIDEEVLVERRLDLQRVQRAAGDEFVPAPGEVHAGAGEGVNVGVTPGLLQEDPGVGRAYLLTSRA